MNKPQSNQRDAIQPITFEPVTTIQRSRRQLFNLATVLISILLLICFTVLWFLLTSQTLALKIMPVDAKVSFKGGLVLNLSNAHVLRPGSYQINISAKGYYPRQQSVTITHSDNQQLAITLAKKPGQLEVTTEPEGVTVTLDNQVQGITPNIFADIPFGNHQLTLSYPRYRSIERSINIQGMGKTDSLTTSLEPLWGLITFDSKPSGAEVIVENKVLGTTPITLSILEQGENVQVRHPGYKTWKKFLYGKIGEAQNFESIVLAPADAQLKLTSQPSGATVMVDKVYLGRTPIKLALTPNKQHRVTLIEAGFHSYERTLTLKTGEQKSIVITLKANTGTLRIETRPVNAIIYVDGKKQQLRYGMLSLPARPHSIEARLDGYVTQRKEITPKPGVEQKIKLTLLTAQEAKKAQLPARLVASNGQSLLLFAPSAPFTMGSSRRERGRRANEVQKRVQITKHFYLATTPVTNAEFKKFSLRHSSNHFSGNTLDLPAQPVVNINWINAINYCNWLSNTEGLTPFYQIKDGKVVGINANAKGYRLPTEAEWAWVAREDSGTMKKFSWGTNFPPPSGAGNYADLQASNIVARIIPGYKDGYRVSAPVNKVNINKKGITGLGHNVTEWVHDYYGIEPTLGGKILKDTMGPTSGNFHVIKGASWRHGSISELRLSFRDYGNDKRDDTGFRLARYAD